MAFLLDTDHISLLHRREEPACSVLERRLNAIAASDLRVSIVSFEEQSRGWLAWLRRAKKPEQVLKGYSYLSQLLGYYATMLVLPFEASSLSAFERLKRARIRIGICDLRIGAIALVHGTTLLTRNLRDFRQIPGLDVEDWTVP